MNTIVSALQFGWIILITLCGNTMAQSINNKEHIKFLALGDSYTIGESVSIEERWPSILVDELRKKKLTCNEPTIIATTGWRTDDLKNAIQSSLLDKPYNLVSLLIGVNNQYQGKPVSDYRSEFEELLIIAINSAGGNKRNVFVLSIPDYGFTPFGEEKKETISKAIDEFNKENRLITEKLGVTYIDITDISRQALTDPELIADDGLHPSGKMYRQWVERILGKIVGD